MTSTHQILLLGPTVLLQNEEEVRLSTAESVLLAVVALEGHIKRSWTADLMWPSSSTSAARHTLSQTLYSLRKKTGLPLSGDRDHILLASQSLDLATFRNASEEGDWRVAAEQVRGTLCEGLVWGKGPVDEWLDIRRREVAAEFNRLMDQLAGSGDWGMLRRVAQCLAKGPVPNPNAEQALVFSLRGIGRLQEASELATEIRQRWRLEIGNDFPLPLSAHAIPSSARTLSGPGFVGREQEMAALDRCWQRIREEESPELILVEGEPGIGKTTLIERFARLLAIRGCRVLWADASLAESKLAFGIVSQWLRSLEPRQFERVPQPIRNTLRSAFPFLAPNGDSDQAPFDQSSGELQLFECIRRQLACAHQNEPIALIVDDYQWADPSSKAFVHFLHRLGVEGTCILILARRPGDEAIPWGPKRRASRLQLCPFSREDVSLLLTRSGIEGNAGDLAKDYWERTGGNPFLVSTLIAASQEGGNGIPESAAEFLGRQLDQLSPPAQRFLAALSILAIPASSSAVAAVAAVATLTNESVGAVIDELGKAELIVETPSGITLRHRLIGETATRRLPEVVQREMRGRAGRVLQEVESSGPAVLALQYDNAGQAEAAVAAALKAAEGSLALHAYREGEFFLKVALANSTTHRDWGEAALQLAHVQAVRGKLEEAEDLLRSCPFESPKELRDRINAQLSTISVKKNPTIAEIERLIDRMPGLEPSLSPEIAGEAWIGLASAAHEVGLAEEAVECALEGLRLVKEVTTPRGIIAALKGGVVIAFNRNIEDGLAVIQEMAPFSARFPGVDAFRMLSEGSVLTAGGQLRRAEERLLVGLELVDRFGLLDSRFHALNNLSVCYSEQGKLHEALLTAQEASRQAEATLTSGEARMAQDNVIIISYEMGKYEQVLELTEAIPRGVGPECLSKRSWSCRWSLRGLAALELGRVTEARECHRELLLNTPAVEPGTNDVSYNEIFLARMEERFGDPDEATSRLSRLVDQYTRRDVCCARRMESELLRLRLSSAPRATTHRAEQLAREIRVSGAGLLLDRVEQIVTRGRMLL